MPQRTQHDKRRSQRGFTLVELMVALAVAAVLMTVAAPSFRRLLSKTDVTQTANDMVGDIATARAEAATRQQMVCLQAIDGDWLKGWQVRVDSDDNGSCSDSGDEIVRERGSLPSGYSIAADRGGTAVTSVGYDPAGTVNGAAADTDIKVCKKADDKAQGMVVIVRPSGIALAHRDTSVTGADCS